MRGVLQTTDRHTNCIRQPRQNSLVITVHSCRCLAFSCGFSIKTGSRNKPLICSSANTGIIGAQEARFLGLLNPSLRVVRLSTLRSTVQFEAQEPALGFVVQRVAVGYARWKRVVWLE